MLGKGPALYESNYLIATKVVNLQPLPQLLLRILLQRVGRGGAGDGVLFLGPGAEVDHLAAFAAERAVFIGFRPLYLGVAGGAFNDSRHGA